MSDAMALSYHRGQSLPASSRKGGMAAVGMGKADVESFLRPGVTIGCENSPSNVTLSGDADVLQQVVTAIQMSNPTTFVRVLNVDMAYHSCKLSAAPVDLKSGCKLTLYRPYERCLRKLLEGTRGTVLWLC